ncbi:MAG: hypothetical protein E6Q32_03175 [Neisseriales bacterium]|nr:MAG: hypothetical protein E6Q32_03175 [Neisseriales bacterium]
MTRVSPNCISGNGRSYDINKLLQQYISTTSKVQVINGDANERYCNLKEIKCPKRFLNDLKEFAVMAILLGIGLLILVLIIYGVTGIGYVISLLLKLIH